MSNLIRGIVSLRGIRPAVTIQPRISVQNITTQKRTICKISAPANAILLNKIQNDKILFSPSRSMGGNPATHIDEIEYRIMYVLSCYDKIPQDQLKKDAHFINDLGLDSLDHVEIIMQIETEFDREIPDDIAESLMTPQEFIDYFAESFDISD